MEPFRDDNDLIAELAALRPAPRPSFAAELDERAAAGFPRRSSGPSSPLSGLLERLRALPPRRLVLSTGVVALAAIAVATVVVATNEPDTNSASLAQLSPSDRTVSPPSSPHTDGVGRSNSSAQAGNQESSGPAGSGESSSFTYEAEVPTVNGHALPPTRESAAAGGAASGGEVSNTAAHSSTGPFAAKAGHRDVERSAEMVLGAEPADVAGDAAKVFDAVHAADGIVLGSSVSGGATGTAGARFDLLIPAAKLSDALAAFSAIDVVVSRHEATDDITAPTVRLGERLRDSRARIDGLLVQLAGADNDAERAEVEAELRTERRRTAALRSQGAKLDRRANLSRVSLRIETGAGATSSNDDSGWGIGDALGDAGHILAIAAGVIIVGLAILTPLALIALLAWFANRARLRRARERTLT